jgi:cyclopropane-fatty-acyl-phospholipid synthase
MLKLLLDQLFAKMNTVPFRVKYWDGTIASYNQGEPRFTISFNKKVPLGQWLRNPGVAFGEAYMNGVVELEGRIEDLIEMAVNSKERIWKKTFSVLSKASSLSKQKQNVQHHYDVGNDFYALWLDETMSYSCAYFRSPEDTITQAQLQKIDHVLRKLQLQPGQTLLDIGSGWGWLIIRAAQQYGVNAKGITLSEEQYKKSTERIAELGLQNQVQVELLDYRLLAARDERFDRIASVGMFEHVGREHFPAFMGSVQQLLKDKGLALLHTITHPTEIPTDPWIQKYIFPGGYIPSLREIVSLLPDYRFHPLDIENLRIHYAMTLDCWADRFEKSLDKVQDMFDQRFIRMWRLYLQSSAAFFRLGELHLHQILFSHGVNNGLPLTREHIYHD